MALDLPLSDIYKRNMGFSYKYFFILLLIIRYSSVDAQKVWTLNECITYTLENNLSIQNACLDTRIQRVNLSQSRLNQLPSVGSGIEFNESFGRSVNPETNTYSDVSNYNNSYSIGTSIALFSGFMKRNQIAFEKYNLQVELNKLEQIRNKTISDVIRAYYNCILLNDFYQLSLENIEVMHHIHYAARRLVDVGRKAESEIYEFDAKLANDSFLLVHQQGEQEMAIIELKKIMNLPFGDTLKLDTLQPFTRLDLKDSIVLNDLLKKSENMLPDFRITEYQLLAAKKYIARMRGDFSPSIEMYAGWNTSYYRSSGQEVPPFNQQISNNAGKNVGIIMSIPLFAKFNRINQLKIAQLNYKKAEIAHQQNIQYIEGEINGAYIDWQTAIKEYEAANRQLEKNKIAFETAQKKLLLGQINVIDFYIQKNEWMKARIERIRTNLQLIIKEKYIRFLLDGKWNF